MIPKYALKTAVTTIKHGLNAEVWRDWKRLGNIPDLTTRVADGKVVLPQIVLGRKSKSLGGDGDFVIQHTGSINITTSGTWGFQTYTGASSGKTLSGAQLFVDAKLVVTDSKSCSGSKRGCTGSTALEASPS